MRLEKYPIEPELLAIGRLFIATRLVLQIIFVVMSLPLLDNLLQNSSLFYLVLFVFIFLYLSSDSLRLRLGRYYLPIALVVTTLGIMLDRPLYVWYMADLRQVAGTTNVTSLTGLLPSGPFNAISSDTSWNPMLFVPLVLIAWQYGFREAIYYVVLTVVIRLTAQKAQEEA